MAAARIADYLAKWALEADGPPFETMSSHLCYVRRGETRAVLKIPNPGSDEHQAARILRHWEGGPAVHVLEQDDAAFVMERALPGDDIAALAFTGHDDEATAIWCDAVAALHTKPAPDGFPDVMNRGNSFRTAPAHPLLPRDLVERAAATFFDLCATQSPKRYLLHADLNHFNVLRDERRGWLVIDPKGFAGELEYETGTFLRNPLRENGTYVAPALLERRVATLCDRLKLDRNRVLGWCFAQGVLSALWSAQGWGDETALRDALATAAAAEALLSV